MEKIISDRKYQDNAAKYGSELLGNDFEGKFVSAIGKIFENEEV
jgi:hypothetical protein